jgi:hypothetical protein
MTLSYSNTYRDKFAFGAYAMRRNPLILIMGTVLLLLITFGILVPGARDANLNKSLAVQIIAFIMVEAFVVLLILAMFTVIILLTTISPKNKTMFCPKTITLGDEMFTSESEYGKSEVRWKMVQKLARTKKHIFIYLAQDSAVVIPRRAFENSTQWEAFYELCKQRKASAT